MASSDVVMEVAESDELAGDEGAQPEPMVVDAGGEAAVEDAGEGASEVGEAKSASASVAGESSGGAPESSGSEEGSGGSSGGEDQSTEREEDEEERGEEREEDAVEEVRPFIARKLVTVPKTVDLSVPFAVRLVSAPPNTAY